MNKQEKEWAVVRADRPELVVVSLHSSRAAGERRLNKLDQEYGSAAHVVRHVSSLPVTRPGQ